jgi:hypothetical protein
MINQIPYDYSILLEDNRSQIGTWLYPYGDHTGDGGSGLFYYRLSFRALKFCKSEQLKFRDGTGCGLDWNENGTPNNIRSPRDDEEDI